MLGILGVSNDVFLGWEGFAKDKERSGMDLSSGWWE